jgi:hypothetical protein
MAQNNLMIMILQWHDRAQQNEMHSKPPIKKIREYRGHCMKITR